MMNVINFQISIQLGAHEHRRFYYFLCQVTHSHQVYLCETILTRTCLILVGSILFILLILYFHYLLYEACCLFIRIPSINFIICPTHLFLDSDPFVGSFSLQYSLVEAHRDLNLAELYSLLFNLNHKKLGLSFDQKFLKLKYRPVQNVFYFSQKLYISFLTMTEPGSKNHPSPTTSCHLKKVLIVFLKKYSDQEDLRLSEFVS